MSDIRRRFEAAYSLISEHHGYIDAQTLGRNEPRLFGVSLEASDDSERRRLVYRYYKSNDHPDKSAGTHAELKIDKEGNIDAYLAQTYAEIADVGTAYRYEAVAGNVALRSERVMQLVELALSELISRSE